MTDEPYSDELPGGTLIKTFDFYQLGDVLKGIWKGGPV